MSLMQRLYSSAPVPVQNLFVTTYGAQLYYERYFPPHTKVLKQLMESQWWPEERLREYQNQRLRSLIKHAAETVPYYKGLFEDHAIDPKSIQTVEDLKRLPILTKETLRTRLDDLTSNKFHRMEILTLGTSGTTGTSLKIRVDLRSRRVFYAFMSRFHRWAGLSSSRNNVTFGGRTVVPKANLSETYWRYNAIMNNWIFSSYHISPATASLYIEKLKSVNPQWIEGYPSSLYALAWLIRKQKDHSIQPKAIITTAETLLDYQRDLIEQVFSCPVYDQYGCTEQALFVSQCEEGSYHLHPEFGIVELLDDSLEEVKPGHRGTVVCTSFVNDAVPLIRYEVGDAAAAGEGTCACGRNFQVLAEISGRNDDYVLTPEGTRVGRLDPVFKGLDSVKEAQIRQVAVDDVLVYLVPGDNYREGDGLSIRNELEKRLGRGINIQIVLTDAVERTAGGKFRAVVSDLTREGSAAVSG